MESKLFRDACNDLFLFREEVIHFTSWLKDIKCLIKDIDTLEILIYPQTSWDSLYREFVIWEYDKWRLKH